MTEKVAEHDQMLTIHLRKHVEEHYHREDDPHYALFERAKARLKKLGLWKCVLDDDYCDGGPELHHMWVEFSDIPVVDADKVAAALGLHFASDEEFQQWVERPGNLEVLCANHHRTRFGVHVVDSSDWNAIRFHRAGAKPPAEFIPAKDLKEKA